MTEIWGGLASRASILSINLLQIRCHKNVPQLGMKDKQYPLKCVGVYVSIVDVLCLGRGWNIVEKKNHKKKTLSISKVYK